MTNVHVQISDITTKEILKFPFLSIELIFNWDQLATDHICLNENVRHKKQQEKQISGFKLNTNISNEVP